MNGKRDWICWRLFGLLVLFRRFIPQRVVLGYVIADQFSQFDGIEGPLDDPVGFQTSNLINRI